MELHIVIDDKRMEYVMNVLMQRPYVEVAETLNLLARQVQQQQAQALQQALPNGQVHDEAPTVN